jgi:hypothetical protein
MVARYAKVPRRAQDIREPLTNDSGARPVFLNERCRHFADGPFDEISGAFFENVRVSGEEANIWSVRLTLQLIYHDCNA